MLEMKDLYKHLPTLETERLLLRKITLEDVGDMYEYASDHEVTKFVTWYPHQSLIETRSFIEYVLQQYKKNKVAPWGIEYKENGKLIGTIDFVWWDKQKRHAEIGYAISKHYWGKGLTTEAASALVQFGFEQMDLVRIQARCLVDNIASKRVMEKIGMSFEEMKKKEILVKGEFKDIEIYAIRKGNAYADK
ncbi:MAG: GNAT family N-acetyltransferase [Bacillaceae bacterium]